ncbi:MAG TPA: xylose isomerase, partial [Porphyromonadaceae bacterium]|nr:xylose isomerase [Porphyromonadaceae bacterium]
MKKLVFLLTGILVSLLIHAQQRPDPQPAPDTFEKFKVGMA